MDEIIDTITIKGYKSIRDLEAFKLGYTNVLIGPNGAGKSNFVSLFHLLRELVEERLQLLLATEGGADACLYLGPKVTKELRVKLRFGQNAYEFSLTPTVRNQLVFSSESAVYGDGVVGGAELPRSLGAGHLEAHLPKKSHRDGLGILAITANSVFHALSSCVIYHFHDTSLSAGVRRQGAINDNASLRRNAENLAAFLYKLQATKQFQFCYEKIRDVVRLAAPFFDDFQLRPIPLNQDKIQLEWRQRGSDYPFLASQLSDGTLRFICLATALLQPDPPRTMLFDEPELGLHPYALSLLGGMFQKAVAPWGRHQIIVSTQSALLLNEFTPEDIIVVQRSGDQSEFRRLDSEELSGWLADYTLGELWQKNLLGGRPQIDEAHAILSPGDAP